ncbi:hypothetical protein [Streptomyces sp. NPDC001492]
MDDQRGDPDPGACLRRGPASATDGTGNWIAHYANNSADCGTTDGTDLRQWPWLNDDCRQWWLMPAT